MRPKAQGMAMRPVRRMAEVSARRASRALFSAKWRVMAGMMEMVMVVMMAQGRLKMVWQKLYTPLMSSVYAWVKWSTPVRRRI